MRGARPARSSVPRGEGSPWGRRLPWVLLGAALALRIAYLLLYAREIPQYRTPLVDAKIYDAWARGIAGGDWLGRGEGVFYRAPLYPYLIAPIYAVFGRPMPWVALIQIGLGMATLGLSALLASRLGGRRAAVATLGLLVLYGPMLAIESKILGTTLGLFLHVASLWLLLRSIEDPRPRRGWAAGIVLGLSALVRPLWCVYAVLFPVLFAARPWDPRSWLRRWLPFGLGVLVVLGPVLLRNRLVGGDWVPISANGGMTLFQGNNIENRTGLITLISRLRVSGSAENQQAVETRVAEELTGRRLRPSQTSGFWARQAIEFATTRPGEWLRLEGRKLYRYVSSFEFGDTDSYALERERILPLRWTLLPFNLLLGLALLGIGWTAGAGPARRAALASAWVGFLGCLVFYVSSRYRMEAVPALGVLGGGGIAALLRSARPPLPRRLLFGGLAVLVAAAGFLPPGPPAVAQKSAGYLHEGNALEAQGRLEEARGAYLRSADLSPENPFVWRQLVLLEDRISGPEAARRRLETVPESVRRNPEVLYAEGVVLSDLGREAEAETAFRAAATGQPLMKEAQARLASLLERQGRYGEAESCLTAALALEPGDPELWSHLAYVRIEQGRYDPARGAALRTLEIRPGSRDAALNLAIADFYLGRLEEAASTLAPLLAPASPGEDGSPGEDPLARYYHGLILLRDGNPTGAAAELARVCALDPGNRRALYYGSLARAAAEGNTTRAGWDRGWLDLYGEGIRPGLAAIAGWIDQRARHPWGSVPTPGERAALDEVFSLPELAPVARDLRRFLAEEGAIPPS
jgi:tetratricopeptide (TPR) repeat protein/4-amino-4-deoxy-L-arabinose transferase-like glycosyltransferase